MYKEGGPHAFVGGIWMLWDQHVINVNSIGASLVHLCDCDKYDHVEKPMCNKGI